ncbi:alpha/beta hydrolase [Actinomadura harenae]|uniref:Esterase n=1 Tax=Actinomadura harenae TaxID=2483351 RepID=A0A3M2LIU4_9ACTN|nr:alpha/beta hydrolase-fold protein [Actinomadura harenae]RMI36453.1 esterase [Actinomadura harenae]
MGPTSGWLIALLILAAVGVTGLAVWLLPRAGGRGPVPIAVRLGLVTASQVTLILAVAAGVNANFLFFVSWSDLFGTTSGTGQFRGASVSGPAAIRPLVRKVSPLGAGSGLRPGMVDGRLEDVTVEGVRTGIEAHAFVYLPRQYFDPAAKDRRFPVSLVLAGYPGDPRGIIKRQGLLRDASTAMANGSVQPTIYVIMKATVVPPRDTECTDVPAGPQVETFFSQDVPQAVAATYRTAAAPHGWGVIGQSTGGYCAVKLAARHSDRFGAAASLGGYLRSVQDPTTGDLYGGSRQVRDENDLIWRLEHLPPPPVAVLLAQTEQGPDFDQAQRYAALAKPPLRLTTLFPKDGGHNLRTFQRLTPDLLKWMSGQQRAG